MSAPTRRRRRAGTCHRTPGGYWAVLPPVRTAPRDQSEITAMKRHLSFVVASGICFFALNAPADAEQVKAETGGIAIGGSVSGSTINIGLPQEKVDALDVRDAKRPLEELTAQQRENIANQRRA